MKQGLQLRLSQQLTMTPQLQQAIRLLQLSTVELQQEIQQALESNPLLEQIDNLAEIDIDIDPSLDRQEQQDSAEALEQPELPEELPLDASWDEIYASSSYPEPGSTGSAANHNNSDDFLFSQGATQTLHCHLQWQAGFLPFSDTEATIAAAIIDAIDDGGYLTLSLAEIAESVGDSSVTIRDIEEVLKQIQRLDPIGIAARDLSECLAIQLAQLPDETPFLTEAYLVVTHYLHLLGNHDFRNLIRRSKLKEETLKEVLELIQTLDPRPGYSIDNDKTEYIIPDVLLRKINGRWSVDLNADSLPRLRINSRYAALGRHGCNEHDSQFIRNNLQEAKWLLKSLESRNETLLKVSRCIVEQQQLFFEQGEEHMKPMVLADIAQAVEMHESTISRVTTQKYLHTPRGIFELKYFFSSHVNREDGGEASSTAIRALVKRLIAEENPVKPFSDSKLSTLLEEKGIIVARRTIAKYRESLSIPPSNLRKQLA